MDDFNINTLYESRNEWSARLVTIMTPLVIEGFKSILAEAIKLCKNNGENDKYLMTFQNLITRIPKWNQQIVETEKKRIIERSGCSYLEDLITCVHIIQLKILTAIRVGQKQKKINISVPKIDEFIHKVYINTAREVYKNVYLFETKVSPLQAQKNNRELELIVRECILKTLRENIPVETVLKAYMDETIEEDVVEEVKEQVINEPIHAPQNQQVEPVTPKFDIPPTNNTASIGGGGVSFSDIDYVKTDAGIEHIQAPKTIERLEEISTIRNEQRKAEAEAEAEADVDDGEKIKIGTEIPLSDALNIQQVDNDLHSFDTLPDLLSDIEVLE